MKDKGLGVGALPKTEWETQLTDDRILSDWSWLLAYEGFRNGWLNDGKGLMQKPLFKPLADRNIVFYDPKKNVETSKGFIAKGRKLRRSQNIEIKLLFEHIRGFAIDEY